MGGFIIRNARIVTDEGIFAGMSVICDEGRIKRIAPDDVTDIIFAEEIDAGGMYLVPGLVDLHVHGLKGYSVESASGIRQMSLDLPRYGVTGYLPSIVPKETKEKDIELITAIAKLGPEGAQILAIMLEGHFLSVTGALKLMKDDNDVKSKVNEMINAGHPKNLVFCISPEYDGMEELLPLMTSSGMPAFITHTRATHEQTLRAIDKGAVHATHFYDVFPYVESTEPGRRGCGAVEAILSRPEVSVDFVMDGVHAEPVAIRMAVACKGIDKVCMITDANVTAGMPPGVYKGIGDIEVETAYEGAPARGTVNSAIYGGIAGSSLTMDKALKNAVEMIGLSVCDAVKTVSTNPLKVLRLDKSKGYIKEGYDADITLLDDRFNVKGCWVLGKRLY